MTCRIRCPHCGAKLNLDEQAVGPSKRCPQCRGRIRAKFSAISVNEPDDPPTPDDLDHPDEVREPPSSRRPLLLAAFACGCFAWSEPPSLWWYGEEITEGESELRSQR